MVVASGPYAPEKDEKGENRDCAAPREGGADQGHIEIEMALSTRSPGEGQPG